MSKRVGTVGDFHRRPFFPGYQCLKQTKTSVFVTRWMCKWKIYGNLNRYEDTLYSHKFPLLYNKVQLIETLNIYIISTFIRVGLSNTIWLTQGRTFQKMRYAISARTRSSVKLFVVIIASNVCCVSEILKVNWFLIKSTINSSF